MLYRRISLPSRRFIPVTLTEHSETHSSFAFPPDGQVVSSPDDRPLHPRVLIRTVICVQSSGTLLYLLQVDRCVGLACLDERNDILHRFRVSRGENVSRDADHVGGEGLARMDSATTFSLTYRTHDVGVGLESGMNLRFVLKYIKCGSHDCGSGQPGDSRRQDILQLTFSTFQCFNQVVLFDDFASGLTT